MSKKITNTRTNSRNPKAHRVPGNQAESRSDVGLDLPEELGLTDPAIAHVVLQWLVRIFAEVRAINAPSSTKQTADRAIRLPELISMIGLSKSAIYDRLNPRSPSYQSDMPRPFKLGKSDRSPSVWWHHEVVTYLKSHADLQRNN